MAMGWEEKTGGKVLRMFLRLKGERGKG